MLDSPYWETVNGKEYYKDDLGSLLYCYMVRIGLPCGDIDMRDSPSLKDEVVLKSNTRFEYVDGEEGDGGYYDYYDPATGKLLASMDAQEDNGGCAEFTEYGAAYVGVKLLTWFSEKVSKLQPGGGTLETAALTT